MDWYGIWYWVVDAWDKVPGLLASSGQDAHMWAVVAVSGCLALEGIRRFVRVARLRRHVRKFEQAETDHRLGVVEKPRWERKRNKETRINGRIYHPVQRDPGGIWLQIASTQDEVQSQVFLVGDLEKLIHSSVDFHSSQHKGEVAVERSLGVVFIAAGMLVGFAYYLLNLLQN
jgi:hypothetical protein